jgi:hypothetical protein
MQELDYEHDDLGRPLRLFPEAATEPDPAPRAPLPTVGHTIDMMSDEYVNLYKLAVGSATLGAVAEEALNIAAGLVQDEIGLVDKGMAAQRIRELRKRLEETVPST